MNCSQSQKYILLHLSGELNRLRYQRLQHHMKQCESCRRFSAEVNILQDTIQKDLSDRTIPAFTKQSIMDAAEREWQRKTKRHKTPTLTWKPAFAYAALSILVLLTFLVIVQPLRQPAPSDETTAQPIIAQWQDNIDEELDQIDELLTLASIDPTTTDNGSSGNDDMDINQIAEELLTLEGIEI